MTDNETKFEFKEIPDGDDEMETFEVHKPEALGDLTAEEILADFAAGLAAAGDPATAALMTMIAEYVGQLETMLELVSEDDDDEDDEDDIDPELLATLLSRKQEVLDMIAAEQAEEGETQADPPTGDNEEQEDA